MRKTVLVLTAESPEAGGGAEHHIRELVRGLEARGYHTEVFHRGNSEPKWFWKPGGSISAKLSGTLAGYWIGRQAQTHINRDVVAVISNSDCGYYPLRCQNAVKKLHFYHGTYRGQAAAIRQFIKHSGHLYLTWWSSMVLERMSGRSKLVLCNSDQTSEEVRRYFGLDSVTMWLPIDTERFTPGDAAQSRKAFNLPNGKPIGLFVGSIHPMKGLPVVHSMIDRCSDVHWVLALRGGGAKADLERSNVTVFKDVPHDQIPALYRAADFSVCPSLYEPFGYVVAEALACGTPVIATPGGASCAFLKDPPLDQLLIPAGARADRFGFAVRKVLQAPDYYRRKVMELARPRLVELMSPVRWWQRFFEITDL